MRPVGRRLCNDERGVGPATWVAIVSPSVAAPQYVRDVYDEAVEVVHRWA